MLPGGETRNFLGKWPGSFSRAGRKCVDACAVRQRCRYRSRRKSACDPRRARIEHRTCAQMFTSVVSPAILYITPVKPAVSRFRHSVSHAEEPAARARDDENARHRTTLRISHRAFERRVLLLCVGGDDRQRARRALTVKSWHGRSLVASDRAGPGLGASTIQLRAIWHRPEPDIAVSIRYEGLAVESKASLTIDL